MNTARNKHNVQDENNAKDYSRLFKRRLCTVIIVHVQSVSVPLCIRVSKCHSDIYYIKRSAAQSGQSVNLTSCIGEQCQELVKT